ILNVLRTLYADYSTVLARTRAPPGLPVPNPSSSFWQDAPPHPELCDVQSSPAGPPETADIVIIGSGITAAAVARTVLQELARKEERTKQPAAEGQQKRRGWVRVLVLEARQLCSGATGRNGGHIKASPHELFHRLTHDAKMAKDRAAALCALQTSHVSMLKEVVQDEELEAVSEFREVRTVDLAVDEVMDAKMKAQADEFAPYAPEGYELKVYSGEEARGLFAGSEHVVGAVAYPAGALWPYRFVTGLWRKLLDRSERDELAIETGTAVTAVEVVSGEDRFPYVVSTSRGNIRARHVVHATNGFAAQLVPGLLGKATGVLCHMTAQQPGQDFPDHDGKQSWSVIYNQGFDYITQRPNVPSGQEKEREGGRGGGGGEIMLGGGLFQSGKQGMDMFGVYDDSKTDAMTLMHLEGVMPTVFRWGAEAPGRRVIKAWSGVVGFTADVLPLVGRLDPRLTKRQVTTKHSSSNGDSVKPGEWIAAYFCGDGMVWSWLCGTAVGIMLAGSEDEDLPKEPGRPAGRLASWFPPELQANWARVKGMDIADLAGEL
ncbi:DAO-domain-containing protein, partial [Cryphonectria parasitica EP155]